MDRRSFLQAGTASAAAHLLGVRASNSRPMTDDRTADGPFVVADGRYAESLAFAQALARRKADILRLQAGSASLWFDVLLPRMPLKAPIIGLTLESDRFVVQRLAGDLGMRAIYTGLHDWRRRPGSNHVLSGHMDLDSVARALSQRRDSWAVRLARALGSAKPACTDRQERRVRLDIDRAEDSPGFLASWVLMP